MKLAVLAILVAVAALGAALLLLSDGGIDKLHQVTDPREAMGVSVTITASHPNAQAAQMAIDLAFARIAKIESVASPANEASELSELNRTGYLPSASDELVEMLRLASVVNRVSDGALDVTIGAWLDLWQFDPTVDIQFWDRSPAVQSASITAAQKHVGMGRILLGGGRTTSISLVPGTIVDLGTIAVGYAVDAAIEALREAGIESAMVEAEGAARIMGSKPDGSPWVAVFGTQSASGESIARFHLTNEAIVMRTVQDERLSPAMGGTILDPRTGYPAVATSGAVVIAPSCAEACALAAAVYVLGPADGLALIERLEYTEALMIGRADPQDVCRSSGLTAFESQSAD
ncbi:FAD:protein FMN transferase [Candidatus Bipolaricaulota bacterium]|nr:FAD:protein FMN transferase [Candidatus Bipolaricaulota bacterium]